MKVAEIQDVGLQQPQMIMQHIQVMLQAMLLSTDDELVQSYHAVLAIFNKNTVE